MVKNFENNYGYKKCPLCGSPVYTTGGEEDYDNIWCADPNFECEWFTEIDINEQRT